MSQFRIENQGTNSFLVYSLSPADEIDKIGLGMISNNKIPNMLPTAFNQIDSERNFRYNISSTVSLQKFLEGTITKKRALNMFKSICNAFIISEDYLLDSNQFLLNPQYIFIEPTSGTASMAYLAIIKDNGISGVDYALFFKQLIIMIKCDTNDDCTYIASILSYLNTNDNFSLHGFQQLLASLGGASGKLPASKEIGQSNMGGGVAVPRKREPDVQMKSSGGVPKRMDSAAETSGPDRKKGVEYEQNRSAPNLSKPATERDVGFEIPGGGFVSGGSKAEKKRQENSGSDSEQDEMKLLWLLRNFSSENLGKYREQKQKNGGKSEKKKAGENKKAKKNKKNQALILTSLDKRYAYVWVVNGDRFTIGRRRTNDGILADVSNKISREHCAIVKENGDYYVIDQNSRCGTIVDGVLYQGNETRAELHEGSILELPEIMFRVSFQ